MFLHQKEHQKAVQIVIGSMAVSHFVLDLWTFLRSWKFRCFETQMVTRWVSLSHFSLKFTRYVTTVKLKACGSGSGTARCFYFVHFSPDLERVWQNVSKSWTWDRNIGPISTKQVVVHLCFELLLSSFGSKNALAANGADRVRSIHWTAVEIAIAFSTLPQWKSLPSLRTQRQ